MKAARKNNALEGIKKEQLKRRVFTLEFKAEVVRHKKAENLTPADRARKFDVLPKLIQHWEKQYDAGQLTVAAGRRAVSPEQAEITRLRAELSRAKMEVSILKKATVYFAKESQ
jgi:transposase